MANDFGALLNEVGSVLAQDVAYPLDNTFLYVEADWGWVDISIFKDLGSRLFWRDATFELSEILLALWEAADPDKRWHTMQYRIEGGRFEASFTYDKLDPEVSTLERRLQIMQERYGNKSVDFPPFP